MHAIFVWLSRGGSDYRRSGLYLRRCTSRHVGWRL